MGGGGGEQHTEKGRCGRLLEEEPQPQVADGRGGGEGGGRGGWGIYMGGVGGDSKGMLPVSVELA
jgi:hypothetical protein